MIRQFLTNQQTEFTYDSAHDKGYAKIKGVTRNGKLVQIRGTSFYCSTIEMAAQTLNSFFEEELKMKYEYESDPDLAKQLERELEDFVSMPSPQITGEQAWTT